MNTETISAISTPPGPGGIGVIRLSGPRALKVLKRIFKPSSSVCEFTSHQMYYGKIVDPLTLRIVDEVLAVFMKSPRTYTREDVVEISCHGNFLVLKMVLELIIAQDVRLAEPGEFTKRAFLNGRIDLTQAEAVVDVLSARTRRGADLAMNQLNGRLYDRVNSIRTALTEMRAIVEVAIDFPDEDVEIVDHESLKRKLQFGIEKPLEELIKQSDQGRIYREGMVVVIAGVPNVGKSSLLNTLLQEDRALVTDLPGTTRDTIEEFVDINGVPVKIVDTAGIREDVGRVEELGIIRAKEQVRQADLVLFMLDGSLGFTELDAELFAIIDTKPIIVVVNKADKLGVEIDNDVFGARILGVEKISAKYHQGIDSLKQAIYQSAAADESNWGEESCAPNIRHKNALLRAQSAAAQLGEGLSMRATSDLLAIDLQECVDQLNDIVGKTTTEDVFDIIFEQFCLGK